MLESYIFRHISRSFAKDKRQKFCGDLVLGWAVLLFVKSSRIIILYMCKQTVFLITRRVNK